MNLGAERTNQYLCLNPNVAQIVHEGREIMKNPDRLLEMSLQRFHLRAVEFSEILSQRNDTFRVGIAGYPNRNKTGLAQSLVQTFSLTNIPTNFHDLDIYQKRIHVPQQEISESIDAFSQDKHGLIIADLPGRLDDPEDNKTLANQLTRLRACDLAIILSGNFNKQEIVDWGIASTVVGTSWRFLATFENRQTANDEYPPRIPNINRNPCISIASITAANSILEEAMGTRGLPLSDLGPSFTQAEQTVLEEILDFEYSILNV